MDGPTTAIFIKSYKGDFEWLSYCLRSIQKFATGFSEVVIVIPDTDNLDHLTAERVVKEKERGNGYFWQMAVKINAPLFTAADVIMYVDSDCVFTKPFDASELFAADGKLKLLWRRWEEAGEGIVWKAPADKALGWETKADTMCRHPMAYYRDTLLDVRGHIELLHGVSFEDYVLGQDRFIEFVTIGNYAMEMQRDRYFLVDSENYPTPIKQSWSWGGLTPEIRAELELIVA